MDICTYTTSETTETQATTHPGGVREMLLGESITLKPVDARLDSVTVATKPDGSDVTIDGATLTPDSTGRYRFVVVTTTDVITDVHVLVVAPAVLDAIPDEQAAGTRSGVADPVLRKRLILRSLATYAPAFDGTVESLRSVGSLAPYGG